MVEKARGLDLLNPGGLVLRASPTLWKIRQLVQEGDWVLLRRAPLREDACLPEGGIYRSSWKARLSGRGILWEENIHDLDTLLYLLGPLELVSATMDHHAEAPGIDVGTRVELRTEGGSPVHFSSLWHAVEGRGSRRHLELFFDRGMVVTEYFVTGEVLVQSGGGEPVVLGGEFHVDEFIAHHGYPAQLRHRKQYPWYAAFATLAFSKSRNTPGLTPSSAPGAGAPRLFGATWSSDIWTRRSCTRTPTWNISGLTPRARR